MNDILQTVADNDLLCQALRALLEKQFTLDTIELGTMNNETIGEIARAHLIGMKKIDNAFHELSRHRKPIARDLTVNRAY